MLRLYSKILGVDSLLIKSASPTLNFSHSRILSRNFSIFLPNNIRSFSPLLSENENKSPPGHKTSNINSSPPKIHSFSNVNISKTLSIKDLDWISSKVSDGKEPVNDSHKGLRSSRDSATKRFDTNKRGDKTSKSLDKSSKGDYLTKYREKWAKPDEASFNGSFSERVSFNSKSILENMPESSKIFVPAWKTRKEELAKKLNGEHWSPVKRLSRPAMDRIRFLAKEFPEEWTFLKLSTEFKISFEAVRRIVKSKFRPPEDYIQKQENKRKQKRLEFLRTLQSSSKSCSPENDSQQFFSAAISLKKDSISNEYLQKTDSFSSFFKEKPIPKHRRRNENSNTKPNQSLSNWKPQGDFEGWDKL